MESLDRKNQGGSGALRKIPVLLLQFAKQRASKANGNLVEKVVCRLNRIPIRRKGIVRLWHSAAAGSRCHRLYADAPSVLLKDKIWPLKVSSNREALLFEHREEKKFKRSRVKTCRLKLLHKISIGIGEVR
jgi:hypothetical protein